jgi:hypothetical protein
MQALGTCGLTHAICIFVLFLSLLFPGWWHSALIHFCTVVKVEALLEIAVKLLFTLHMIIHDIIHLFAIKFVGILLIVFGLDHLFGLRRARRDELDVVLHLIKRSTVLSPVENLLPTLTNFGLVKHLWRREWACSAIVVVQLLACSRPHEISERRLGLTRKHCTSSLLESVILFVKRHRLFVRDINIHHLHLGLFIFSEHWKMFLLEVHAAN